VGVYGKILQINRTASAANPVTKIRYDYDAVGNRINKEVHKSGTSSVEYGWQRISIFRKRRKILHFQYWKV
jgi:YD repeat-containing protein